MSLTKRHLAVTLAAALMGAIPAFAAAQITVSSQISPANVAAAALPNSTFQVQVVATGIGASPITSYDFVVKYDRTRVDLTSVASDSWVVNSFTVPAPGTNPGGLVPATYRHISGVDLAGTNAAGASGSTRTLATLTFTTTSTPFGPYDITFGPAERDYRDPNQIVIIQNGSLTPADGGVTTINSAATQDLGTAQPDRDLDAIPDALESATTAPATGPNGFLADSDGDGLLDSTEVAFGDFNFTFNPGVDTNPRNEDTDNDGYLDGLEVKFPWIFTNGPLVADTLPNQDGDDLPDALDPNPLVAERDFDNDFITDSYELALGFSPTNAASRPVIGDLVGNPPGSFNAADVSAAFQFFRLGTVPPRLTNIDAIANGQIQANDGSRLAQRSRGVLTDANAMPAYPTR
jgi:hypothetical protein